MNQPKIQPFQVLCEGKQLGILSFTCVNCGQYNEVPINVSLDYNIETYCSSCNALVKIER